MKKMMKEAHKSMSAGPFYDKDPVAFNPALSSIP
jgi:hypothetical protein